MKQVNILNANSYRFFIGLAAALVIAATIWLSEISSAQESKDFLSKEDLMLSKEDLMAPTAATITGRVFQDFNGNGTFDTSGTSLNPAIDTGIIGVTVSAYDANGAARGSTTTVQCTGVNTPVTGCLSATDRGMYSLAATGTGPYRIEFTTIPTGYSPSTRSTDSMFGGTTANSGSTVQFLNDVNTSNVNLALTQSAIYSEPNPLVITPRYNNGNNTGTDPALVGIKYDLSGGLQTLATANQIGATWGVAFRKRDKKVFASAVLRRHVAFGPGKDGTRGNADDISTIYTFDYPAMTGAATLSLAQSINLAALGINVGANPRIGSSPANDLAGTATPSHDYGVFQQVGRRGIGGIALSEDENTMYVVNLNSAQPQLVSLNISNLSSVTLNGTVNIPNPGCPGTDTAAPWAVKVNAGNVYVGTVCTADVSQNYANLRAYLLQLNGGSFNQVDLDSTTANNYISMVYDRTFGYFYIPASYGTRAEWLPWHATFPTVGNTNPTPIFSDMNFAPDGSIAIGIMDRTGHQVGYNNYSETTADTTLYNNISTGDYIKICKSGSNFIPEGKAGCTQSIAQPSDATTAPVGKPPEIAGTPVEFFNDNSVTSADEGHIETFFGGMTSIPGVNTIVGTQMNPTPIYNAGGLRWLNTSTGASSANLAVYQNATNNLLETTFGKANGLGDVELLTSPASIEIGNRVWRDANANGVQDPGENPISGITVRLYQSSTLVGTAVTDTNGEYYFVFSSVVDPNTTDNVGQVNGGIQYNTAYQVRFDNLANYNTGGPLNGLLLTTVNQTSQNGDDDSSDSDATTVANPAGSPDLGAFPVISLTTGGPGSNNHTFDVGFASVPTAANASVEGRVMLSAGNGVRNATVILTEADGTQHTAVTGSLGYYRFTDIEAGQTVIVSVRSKRFTFNPSSRILTLSDSFAGLDFIAEQ